MKTSCSVAAASLAAAASVSSVAGTPRLAVSENRRFLVHAENGKPFFYLGDTAWELVHRATREEVDQYLELRSRQEFTVIQTVLLGEFNGLDESNAYGHRPLIDNDPARPDVREGPANDYWDHADYIVDKAASLGLFVGLLPTWGDKWNKKWGRGPEIFTPANAAIYGAWLGRRYREKPVIWILGGDRPIENEAHAAIMRAMAAGLAEGDGGVHLRTLHPSGGRGSSEWFHNDDWLDFNMRQNGHEPSFNPRYEQTRADYMRVPTKPVIDGEPLYEGHPLSFKAADHGYSIAADVRRCLYWDLFAGACGHTYGHHSVWQMWRPGREPVNNPLMPWNEAVLQPGGLQMRFARRLLVSRPFLTRIPDDALIVPHTAPHAVPNWVPGAGMRRLAATRDSEGSYAMVYTPVSITFSVRMDVLAGKAVQAWWFDPRTGTAERIGTFPATGTATFTPPAAGEMMDWVLVLDDVSRGFPPPGQAEG